MNLDIKRELKKDVALISIKGEIDMLTSPEVRDALLPFFDKDVKGIVVDLSDVAYMDSSGIATMVEGLQWSRAKNKKFILTGLAPKVMDVFVLTNLKDAFEFSPGIDSAIKVIEGT